MSSVRGEALVKALSAKIHLRETVTHMTTGAVMHAFMIPSLFPVGWSKNSCHGVMDWRPLKSDKSYPCIQEDAHSPMQCRTFHRRAEETSACLQVLAPAHWQDSHGSFHQVEWVLLGTSLYVVRPPSVTRPAPPIVDEAHHSKTEWRQRAGNDGNPRDLICMTFSWRSKGNMRGFGWTGSALGPGGRTQLGRFVEVEWSFHRLKRS